jgi:hypothetical protein
MRFNSLSPFFFSSFQWAEREGNGGNKEIEASEIMKVKDLQVADDKFTVVCVCVERV